MRTSRGLTTVGVFVAGLVAGTALAPGLARETRLGGENAG